MLGLGKGRVKKGLRDRAVRVKTGLKDEDVSQSILKFRE